jgi:hypothetical protein
MLMDCYFLAFVWFPASTYASTKFKASSAASAKPSSSPEAAAPSFLLIQHGFLPVFALYSYLLHFLSM